MYNHNYVYNYILSFVRDSIVYMYNVGRLAIAYVCSYNYTIQFSVQINENQSINYVLLMFQLFTK